MSVAQYSIDLDWKGFNLDLNAIDAWMKANAGEEYCGCSANSKLQLHFLAEPSEDVKEAIESHWAGLDEESAEAVAYKSQAARAADVAAKKASGKAKLIALGLSEDEAAALVG